jgi:hypothetical protein
MRAHWVHVERELAAPPEQVFDHLAEHENLAALFGARVKRLNDGDDGSRNGVGSRRELRIAPGAPPFEETTTEYRITKGSPLRDHVGIMRFAPTPSGGTRFDYRIRLASRIPGLAPIVRASLTRSIQKGLRGAPGGGG